MRRRISSGSSFETDIGYSRAVVDGDMVYVSGTTGYDYQKMTIGPGVVEQCEQALKNISAALAQAGSSLDEVVRIRYIVPDREDWPPCWPVLRRYLGRALPAATLIHAGLLDPAMRIEIEATARLSRALVEGLDHLVITCQDVGVSAAWYQRVLGMERLEFRGRTAVRFGSQKLNLRPVSVSQAEWFSSVTPGPGTQDLCFLVTRTPAQVVEHLEACGVAVELGPVEKAGARGPIQSVYCRDPDGNLIELASY